MEIGDILQQQIKIIMGEIFNPLLGPFIPGKRATKNHGYRWERIPQVQELRQTATDCLLRTPSQAMAYRWEGHGGGRATACSAEEILGSVAVHRQADTWVAVI